MNAKLSQLVEIPADTGFLEGMLELPPNACGVVLFAHGSGSRSPRDDSVAERLRDARLGTLLIDLLLAAEDASYEARFDIPLLTRRLAIVAQWIAVSRAAGDLPIGLFGAATGAAAAFRLAAADRPAIAAVVSRGGRPDLAGSIALRSVRAPTLLIVGAEDHDGIDVNRSAYDDLRCEKRMELVSGATRLFEEPGTWTRAAALASRWFERQLQADVGAFAFMR